MLIKLGVDISHLKRPIRRVLNTIEDAFRDHRQEAVITSTCEGNHSPSSLHYAHLAVDIRNPVTGHTLILQRIKTALGPDFDVIAEENHIHIEYDPKTPNP